MVRNRYCTFFLATRQHIYCFIRKTRGTKEVLHHFLANRQTYPNISIKKTRGTKEVTYVPFLGKHANISNSFIGRTRGTKEVNLLFATGKHIRFFHSKDTWYERGTVPFFGQHCPDWRGASTKAALQRRDYPIIVPFRFFHLMWRCMPRPWEWIAYNGWCCLVRYRTKGDTTTPMFNSSRLNQYQGSTRIHCSTKQQLNIGFSHQLK